ncbi:phosphatase PAP2 family protein [Streptomyces palmae]|uniref:Phosphatase PAP2 family protein n=1 Tax=Streptomyces palmae TaxID=1701085 RepID=A0A4Z0G6X7_9ACTN|nr:phosphatase PAP2 family protein [Streptomyces palmae]TGA91392.1 phosphatase PAP2 family protein [Streptomyces palmae]
MTSSDLYRHVTDAAHDSPEWLRSLAEFGTDGGIVLLLLVAAATWWRARQDTARTMAAALLVPLATVLAYGISEVLKSLIEEDRPCRAVAHAAPSIAECPPPGDWSFPSNHSTLAAAIAVGIVFAWRRIALLVLPVAVLLAFSRVFVGVHYPHDVAAGFTLGTLTAVLCARLLTGPLAARVDRLRPAAPGHAPSRHAARRRRNGGPAALILGPGPRPAPAPAPAPAYPTSY